MRKLTLLFLLAASFFLFADNIRAAANPLSPCPPGESRYRPGGACERTVPAVETDILNYPLTCQDIPLAKLEGDSLFQVALGSLHRRTITSDISQAELGGLGPNAQAIGSYTEDALAQIYPFNGLFDRPISLANQPREAARTYWRLMSAYQQANAKAAYIQLVKNSLTVNNTSILFYNPNKATPTPTPTGTTVPGSDKLGINIGYGHLDPKFGADASGRPVTFLVDLNMDEATLRQYADLYAGASMRIVRIKSFSASTPLSEFSAAGTRFSNVFGNDYVLLGNELNSIDVEYTCSTDLTTCGATYASQFAAFDSTFTGPNLSAAPLNVGNPINDAVPFFNGAKSAYLASTFLANNSYQSPSCAFEAIRCSKDSYKWFSQQVGTGAPVILTEYGLAPPDLDKNLVNVMNFYSTLPGDVLAVTPLIRNVCSSAKGEWLHFNKQNQLVDLDGKIVDPATCGTSGAVQANDSLTVLELADRLPACLTNYPVCKDYAKAYLDLSDLNRTIYDAMLPFNFDNVRGYQVLNNIVYKENLPYVRAITDGLNNPQTGLLSALSPQWINDLRARNLKTNAFNDGTVLPALEDVVPGRNLALLLKANLLNPNDCLIHDNSTYLPSPYTYPQGNLPLSQDVDIQVTNVTLETERDANGILRTRWKFTGSKEGKPVSVLNNPKLEDLNQSLQGPQSLYALFVPAAADPPDRDMTAPIAKLTADRDDTKVEGVTWEEGSARIARTGGQATTSLCELRNKWLIPAGLQKNNVNCVDPYQSLTTSIQGPGVILPIPEEINCNANAPAGNPGNLLPVDALVNIGFPSGASKENLQKCYNDLVSRSNAAGYDPAFVMAIWLEESAASWYDTYPNSADFGCVVGRNRMDFNDQISCFLNLKGAYANRPSTCLTSGGPTYEGFLLIFSEGNAGACRDDTATCTLPDGNTVPHYRNFCTNPQFPDRIRQYYQLVTGGKSLNFSSPM